MRTTRSGRGCSRRRGASFEREGLISRALERYQTVARLVPVSEEHFTVARLQESLRRYGARRRRSARGLQLLPAGARRGPEAWVAARLEDAEKKVSEARREELMADPRRQDMVEHLLETSSDTPP